MTVGQGSIKLKLQTKYIEIQEIFTLNMEGKQNTCRIGGHFMKNEYNIKDV